jgi:phosphomannomutase
VQNITTDKSDQLITMLTQDPAARMVIFTGVDREVATDLTDGLRLTFKNGTTVHIRQSGNAPECRCYVEAITLEMAQTLVEVYLQNWQYNWCSGRKGDDGWVSLTLQKLGKAITRASTTRSRERA